MKKNFDFNLLLDIRKKVRISYMLNPAFFGNSNPLSNTTRKWKDHTQKTSKEGVQIKTIF